MRLPTCHDGVKNCDKVYFPKVNTVFYKEEVRAAEEILNLTIKKIISWLFVFLAHRNCPVVLKLQNASGSHCNRVFLTDNKAC